MDVEKLDSTEIEGMKIREIREKFDREEVSINIIQLNSPRSGDLLQNPTETKGQLLERTDYQPGKSVRYKGYTEEELIWELPLDKKIQMDVVSGLNEGGTKNLNVGNIQVDQGEISMQKKT